MTLFDLLFLATFLLTITCLGAILFLILRGRRKNALRLTAALAAMLTLYFGALTIVSLASPRTLVPVGQDRCFDDWCVALEKVSV